METSWMAAMSDKASSRDLRVNQVKVRIIHEITLNKSLVKLLFDLAT